MLNAKPSPPTTLGSLNSVPETLTAVPGRNQLVSLIVILSSDDIVAVTVSVYVAAMYAVDSATIKFLFLSICSIA